MEWGLRTRDVNKMGVHFEVGNHPPQKIYVYIYIYI